MPVSIRLRSVAVLFDMDGTLVDSTQSVERQWRRWAARVGLDAAGIIAVAHGRRTLDVLHQFAPHLATVDEAARFDAEEAQDREGVVAVPGAVQLVESLPKQQWAVVTSADRVLATDRLRTAGLPVPPVLVTGDEVTRGKPDPEGYLKAARLLEVAPADCLVLEDTPAGVEAGRAAGMQVIALATTYTADDFGATLCVPDLRWLSAIAAGAGLDIHVLTSPHAGDST
jgi:sugar-phosphatase